MDPADITNRFNFHPATTVEKRNAHTDIRQNCMLLAGFLNELLPEGQEKSLAITNLELVMFWSNAALARNNEEEPTR